MKSYLRKKSLVITGAMILVSVLTGTAITIWQYFNNEFINVDLANAKIYNESIVPPADNGDNVNGFAWGSSIGWISFNSSDCDTDGNGVFDGMPTACPTSAVTFYDYGVDVDPVTGQFDGYAWSSNVGWIYFGPNANLGATYGQVDARVEGWAKYDSVNQTIKGWAKILSMGDDGWIRFDHDKSNPVTYNPATEELMGYAWNGNDDNTGIGWISFNSSNPDSLGGSYKVIAKTFVNTPPTVINLKAPNWNNSEACAERGVIANLKWTFSDVDITLRNDSQSSYRIIVKNGGTEVFDSGECSAPNLLKCRAQKSSYTYSYKLYDTDITDPYNKNYTWSVIIKDSFGGVSLETFYNTNSATDTDANVDGDVNTFTTYKSAFPNPNNFTWYAPDPSAKEKINFISSDLAKYYTNSLANINNCNETNCSWKWEFPTGVNATFENSDTGSSTLVIFDEVGTNKAGIKLTVTDLNGYECSSSTMMNVKEKLPQWRETK